MKDDSTLKVGSNEMELVDFRIFKKEDEEVFKEDIKLAPKIVYSVVEHLQSLALNKTDLDTKGVAFNRFLGKYFTGDMGQYFTPREIVQFCVKMLNPINDDSKLLENKSETNARTRQSEPVSSSAVET